MFVSRLRISQKWPTKIWPSEKVVLIDAGTAALDEEDASGQIWQCSMTGAGLKKREGVKSVEQRRLRSHN
jgi:hypothetical protein